MLQTIREKSKGPVLTIVVVAISLMFAATGVESILGSSGGQNVAKINGEKVTTQELQEAIFLKKRQLISQMGENIDSAQLEDKKIEGPALEDLVNRKLLLQVAESHGMKISDADINQSIASNPDFQQDGKFSQELLQSTLARSGLTISLYKRLLSTDDLLQQFVSGFIETGFLTAKEIANEAKFTHQKRDIHYIEISLEQLQKNIITTPEEIKAYYDKNNNAFLSKESADVEYILLNQSDFSQTVTDDEIKAAYDQEIKNIGSDEERFVSHIFIESSLVKKAESEKKIQALKEQISKGADFAEVARQSSEDFGSKEAGGELGVLNPEIFPKEFVEAAKALKEGEVSNVVSTDKGLHLIRVNSISKLQPPTFAERKDAIKIDLVIAKSTPAYVQALEQLKDISFNSPDLKEPATTLKTDVRSVQNIQRDKADGLFANANIRKAVFEDRVLKGGENSDVIELSATESIVVRVNKHNEAALLPFDTVKPQVELALKKEMAKALSATKLQSIMSALKSGESFEALASKGAYELKSIIQASRGAMNADMEVSEAAFALPSVSGTSIALDTIEKVNGNSVLIQVSNVIEGKASDITVIESGALKRYIARANAIQAFNAYQASIKENAEIDIFKK